MRLSNDRDQSLSRSAVSDAAANLRSVIPSLGTREVFAFGAGVALPTRMRFKELDATQRPNSEAAGSTRDIPGSSMDRDLIGSVIERWRSATMSHKASVDDDLASPFDQMASAPPLQPAPMQTPSAPPPSAQPAQAFDPNRSRLLKRPLENAGSPYTPGPHFALTHKIAKRNGLKLLSMGMSADFATAIELGATHVRVGSAIFGDRS
jgi:hypothetical protein